MKIEDIKVIGGPLVRASKAEVRTLAERLWIKFPSGYETYVTRLGEGTLGGSLVRIYPPWRIEQELDEWRRRVGKYWLWDGSEKVLPKERAVECVIIGDTVNGDELVFHPMRRETLFVLPRGGDSVFDVGGDVVAAADWMCGSGKLVRKFKARDFEPFDSRAGGVDDRGEDVDDDDGDDEPRVKDPDGESLEDIVDMIKRWAKRHKSRDTGREMMREYCPPTGTTELLYEGIMVEANDGPADVGYAAAWRVLQKTGKKPIGVFKYSSDGDGSEGGSFEPAKPLGDRPK